VETAKISAVAAVLLAGLLVTGCQKKATPQKAPAAGSSASASGIISGITTEPKTVSNDLGAVTLTNQFDTCIHLGAGTDCILTPKMLDRHNMQLTVTVKSKTAAGKMLGLAMAQVIARSGKPVEVTVGDLSLSLTPNVKSE
jgi:hypothetical protein